METGIVITARGIIYKQAFDNLLSGLQEAVCGKIEVIHPMGLPAPYAMIVNDEGLIINLRMNNIASHLYKTYIHGQPIVGDVVIVKEGMRDGEPGIVGLDEDEAAEVKEQLDDLALLYFPSAEVRQ